jgi:cyclase
VLRNRLIPSMLLAGGRLVKGAAYRDWREAGRPLSTARAYNAQGADEIMVLDIEASREGRGPDLEALAALVNEVSVPLTIGGGIASVEIAARCFEAGADKICVNSAALDDPALLDRLARAYGAQAVVLAVDVAGADGARHLYDHRSRKVAARADWLAWLREAEARGAGEIRLSAVDREGSKAGYDLGLFAAARAAVNLPLILEGGSGSLESLAEAMAAGADSLALGTMLVFADNNIVKLKRYLTGAGFPMRL